jgi:predicted molibdopterin-dependent oxidoreductase YjgC
VRQGVPNPGRARPTWEVLVELSALLGEETGIDSVPEALAAIAAEVPFYSGLTEEEIGGLGVRWQERGAASNFPEVPGESSEAASDDVPTQRVGTSRAGGPAAAPTPPGTNGNLQVGAYRDLWAAEVTDRSPALRFLAPKQTIELAPHDADRLGIGNGDEVDVRSNGTSVRARVAIRERVRPGSGFLIEGLGDPAGTLVGELVEISRAGEAE